MVADYNDLPPGIQRKWDDFFQILAKGHRRRIEEQEAQIKERRAG